jgi:hypothetical protein
MIRRSQRVRLLPAMQVGERRGMIQLTSNPRVGGSNPSGRTTEARCIPAAQRLYHGLCAANRSSRHTPRLTSLTASVTEYIPLDNPKD